jgi:hypothetical protein
VKIIGLLWRDHTGSIKAERFNAADFSVKTEPGWLKLTDKNGIFRLIPSDKVHMVEFAEEQEKPAIISPHEVLQPPTPFKVTQ